MTSIKFISHWLDSAGIQTPDLPHVKRSATSSGRIVAVCTHGDVIVLPRGTKANHQAKQQQVFGFCP